MASYSVRCVFNLGISGKEYIFPHVFQINDPIPGMKATVIEGSRGSGSIVIPGGQKSIEILVRGRLIANGYDALNTLITTMKTMVTTDQVTLTLQHYTTTWVQDWSYVVRRIDEIDFPESLRTWDQEYSIRFLIIAY
jgi:hypothetical protein